MELIIESKIDPSGGNKTINKKRGTDGSKIKPRSFNPLFFVWFQAHSKLTGLSIEMAGKRNIHLAIRYKTGMQKR